MLQYDDIVKAQQGKTRDELAVIAQQATPGSPYATPIKRLPNESPEDLVNRLQGTMQEAESIGQPAVQTSEAERYKQKQADLDRIRGELSGGVTPPIYKGADELKRLREEQGIVKDEEELASIRNEALLGKEELRKYKTTAGQGVSEAGRIGAVSEAERNLNFRLEDLSIREQGVLSRLNTKNSYINAALEAGQEDYKTALANYQNEYNRNLKAVDLYNQELNEQQRDALTAFTTVTNLLSKNKTPITSEMSTQLDSLALQAGLPTGVFQQAAESLANANEKVLSPIIVDTDSGKNAYFFTQGQDGEPHLKQMVPLKGSSKGNKKAPTSKFKPPVKTYVDKYDLPKSVSNDDFQSVRTSIREIQREFDIASLSDQERYRLWGETAAELEAQGYNPDDYDAILWEAFHPEGLNGYYKYNKPGMYKKPKASTSGGVDTVNNPYRKTS